MHAAIVLFIFPFQARWLGRFTFIYTAEKERHENRISEQTRGPLGWDESWASGANFVSRFGDIYSLNHYYVVLMYTNHTHLVIRFRMDTLLV